MTEATSDKPLVDSLVKRLMVVVLFLVLLALLFHQSGLGENFSLDFMRQSFRSNPITGGLLFILLFSVGNLLRLPGLIFFAAAVLALGPVWGGLVSYVAGVISSAFVFWVIRLLGGDALRLIQWKWAVRVLARMDERPVTTVAALRTVLMTLPALNVALAMSGVKFRHYMIGTAVGLPLPICLCAVFFDGVMKLAHIAVK